MKSKNSPKHHTPDKAERSSAKTNRRETSVIIDFVQSRIEAFNREQGGGISVHKDARGYTLIREDTGARSRDFAPRTGPAVSRSCAGARIRIAGGPPA